MGSLKLFLYEREVGSVKKDLLSKFFDSLECLNDLTKNEIGLIKGRIFELEYDLLSVIKDNEEESVTYPYYSYDLNLYFKDDLVMSIRVSVDSEITVNEIGDWLLK